MNEIEEMAFTEEERELYRDIWEGLGIQDYWDECIWKKVRVENCSLSLIRKGYCKQKVGRWTFSENGKTMKCTVCRLRMKTYDVRRHCPNCGAKMEGEKQ